MDAESEIRNVFQGAAAGNTGGWQAYVYYDNDEPITTMEGVIAHLDDLSPGNNWTVSEDAGGAEFGIWLIDFHDPEIDAMIEENEYYGLDNPGTGGLEIEMP